jgi:hypothetical protein
MTPEPKGIAALLRRLRAYLIEAEWVDNKEWAASLRRDIARLEMLQSYGETHDVDY